MPAKTSAMPTSKAINVNISRGIDPGCSFGGCQGGEWNSNVIRPIMGHNIAPFVICRFVSNDFCVTVGNESSPSTTKSGICKGIIGTSSQKNHAIISSFQYGTSTGGADGIALEITDEEGGDFCNFMVNILPKNRDKSGPVKGCNCLFQFGWITTGCYDASGSCSIASQVRKCTPTQVDIAFQSGGVIKFTIQAPNPAEIIAEGINTSQKVYGSDSNKMCLKEAIEKLFDEEYEMKVRFLKPIKGKNPSTSFIYSKPGGGTCNFTVPGPTLEVAYDTWEFDEPPSDCPGGTGPKGKWHTNNKDPITAAMIWLQEYKTKDKKGFVFGTSNKKDERPTAIFWEDPTPDCRGNGNMTNIGTFIVNGGKCSNIIEFRPQVNWTMGNVNQGGQSSGETTGKGQSIVGSKDASKNEKAKTFPEITCDISGQGSAERTPISQNRSDISPSTAIEKTNEAHAAQARALFPPNPIQAELVAQGLPELDDPLRLVGSKCGICVINPFTISKNTNKTCGDWLANPPVNKFLSNANWIIRGVSHQIKEGSFTTTLHVELPGPGITLDKNAPLGGPGGPTMPNT